MEGTLFQFTALISGQVGTAIITSNGIKWRATGAVSNYCEIKGSELKKFMATKSNNPKALFQFERIDGSKVTVKVVLTEDQRCGISDEEIIQRERVILEEARAVIKNQKHWLYNMESSSSNIPASSSSKDNDKAKTNKRSSTGEWANISTKKEKLTGQLGHQYQNDRRTKKRSMVQSTQDSEEQIIREHLLASDESLNRQFLELVMENEVISEEDFWESRRHLVSAEIAKRAGGNESLETWWWNKLSQNTNSLNTAESKKFNISLKVDEIYKIFTLFPAVATLYEQKVPHEVSEREFWTNFFKSEFLQLGRKKETNQLDKPTTSKKSSLFASVGNSDDIVTRTPTAVNNLSASVDPSVDLVSVYGDYVSDPTIADVYTPMVARDSDRPSEVEIRESSERASVINRYNHHAERLLHAPITSSSYSPNVHDEMSALLAPSQAGNPLVVSQIPGRQNYQDIPNAQNSWRPMLRESDQSQRKGDVEFGVSIALRDFAIDLHEGGSRKAKIGQQDLRATQRVHELLRHLFSACGTSRTKFEKLAPEKQRKVKAVERRMNEVLKELRQDISSCLAEGRPILTLRVLESQLVKGLKVVDDLQGQSQSRGFVSVSSPRESLNRSTS